MSLHLTIFAKAEGFPIMLVVMWGTLCVSKCWKVVPVKQLGSFKKSRSDVEDVDDCSFSIEGAWWVEQNINRNVDDFLGGLWPNKQILDV